MTSLGITLYLIFLRILLSCCLHLTVCPCPAGVITLEDDQPQASSRQQSSPDKVVLESCQAAMLQLSLRSPLRTTTTRRPPLSPRLPPAPHQLMDDNHPYIHSPTAASALVTQQFAFINSPSSGLYITRQYSPILVKHFPLAGIS